MKKVLFLLGALLLAQLGFSEERVLGKITDRRTGDEIQAVCIGEGCVQFQYVLKTETTEHALSKVYSLSEFNRSIGRENASPKAAMPWLRVSYMCFFAMNAEGGRHPGIWVLSPLMLGLVAIEGAADVILDPGFEIAKAVERARLKKIAAALAGGSVKVNHLRFKKIEKMIEEGVGST